MSISNVNAQFQEDFGKNTLANFNWIGEERTGSDVSILRFPDGNFAMNAYAAPASGTTVGKAYVTKNFTQPVTEGGVVEIQAKYYIPEGTPTQSLYLMDVESRDSGISWKPGFRLSVFKDDITINRGKLGLPEIRTDAEVPQGDWFTLTLKLTLGDARSGHTEVWINENKVINHFGTNMPLEENLGSLNTENFTYAQFGVTANSNSTAVRVYVDDIVISNGGSGSLGTNDGVSLPGSSYNDNLVGTDRDDRLSGSLGNDVLTGGRGNDVLNGGAGADRFVFAPGFGDDVIQDFSGASGDRIDLRAMGYDGSYRTANGNIAVSYQDDGIHFDFDDGSSLVFKDVHTLQNDMLLV